MTSLRFHFAKIADVEPSPISCMSLNHGRNKLALFRGGNCGVIQVWDVKHSPWLEREIVDIEQVDGKPSVESIVWVGDRLFSCGLHGFVVEHDLSTGLIVHKSSATSGSVWCLGVHPNQTVIAAGTEDGFLNLFQIEEKGLSYLRVLDRQEGRVLCLSWSPCGKYIATGSVDSVRLWDVNKGHAVQRLGTGRTKNRETIVWCVLVMEGLVIVSGDSRGIVSFFDGKIGVLKFKIQTHKADVLALKLSADGNCIYTAGVDPLILNITRIAGTDKWIKSHQRNVHLNDVLTLESCGNKLFSGGIDTELGYSSYPPKVIVKYPNIVKPSDICASDSTILVKGHNSITLWKLPNSTQTEPLKLLDFHSKGSQHIYSTTVSPDGKKFAYSTISTFKSFQMTENGGKVALQPIHVQNSLHLPATDSLVHLRFVNNNVMVLISSSGRFVTFGRICDEDQSLRFSSVQELYDIERGEFSLGVGLIATSKDCFSFSIDNRIVIYSIKEEAKDKSFVDVSFRISKTCDLPTYDSIPSSITFHPEKPLLLVTYADHTIMVFNFKVGRILFKQTVAKNLQPFSGACWSSDGTYAMLYQNDCLSMLEVNAGLEIKRRKRNLEDDDDLNFNVRSCSSRCKYVVYVGLVNKDFVVVEVDPKSLLEQLPPAFAKKRFGT